MGKKKITIEKTPIKDFNDPWGGVYHAGDPQPFPDEANLSDGQEWGHTREEVERVLKEIINEHKDNKYGAVLLSDGPNLVKYIIFFADEERLREWQTDPIAHPENVLDIISFQGAAAPESFAMSVVVTERPSLAQILGASNKFSFTYNSYWAGDPTQLDDTPGEAVLTVEGEVKERKSLDAGGNSYTFDVGPYIDALHKNVEITVSNANESSRSWKYKIDTLSLGVEFRDDFISNLYKPKSGEFDIAVKVAGVGGGDLHLRIDSRDLEVKRGVPGGGASSTFTVDTDLFDAGTHTIEVWADDNVYGLVTPHIKADFIKAGATSIAIGANAPTEISMYDIAQIPYFFHIPSIAVDTEVTAIITLLDIVEEVETIVSSSTQKVNMKADNTSGMLNAIINVMDNTYIDKTLYLKIMLPNYSTSITYPITIVSADFTIQQASECKVYYKLGIKTNADPDVIANNMTSSYNGVVTSTLTRSNTFKLSDSSGFSADAKGIVIPAGKTLTLGMWQPFKTDIGANGRTAGTNTGKTIEMEFSIGVSADIDIPVISCIDSNCGFEVYPNRVEVMYGGGAERIITYFPDGERIKFSLVVNGSTTECINDDGNGGRTITYKNLAFIYINGVMVRIFDYGLASWKQLDVKNIVFGSSESELILHSISGYDKALIMKEVVDNFAYDTPELADKKAIAIRNNILKSDGETIDIEKVRAALPNTPIITWWMERLPANKKDPQTCLETEFENPEWTENNSKLDLDLRDNACAPFSAGEHEINGDGTSSNAYPLPYKNWAEKFSGGVTLHLIDTNPPSVAYSITYGIAPEDGEKKFVHKVNFASSEGIFNILAMNMYQDITLAMQNENELLTAQQQAQKDAGKDITFRKSLSGFPEIGFRKHTVNGEVVTDFLSIYNFINNKKTGSMFGMVKNYKKNQLWEVDENRNFFLTEMTEHTVVDGQVVESNGVRENSPLYYARFPDESPVTGNDLGICKTITQVNQANDEIKALREAHNWVVSINPNIAKRYYARYNRYADLPAPVTYGDTTFTQDTPQYRLTKFAIEYPDHLFINDGLQYNFFGIYLLGKDSFDKNMSLFFDILEDYYSEDPDVRANAKVMIRFMLRDTDTIAMFNNTGILMYKYWHEWGDTYNPTTGETGRITGEVWDGEKYIIVSNVAGAEPVFNGRLSGIWDAINEGIPFSQMRDFYEKIRSAGLNYNSLFKKYKEFHDYWCEMLYNKDGMGYANTGNLTMAYGDKFMLSKYFFKMRERYMDSKYAHVNENNRVTVRLFQVPTGVWMKHSTPIYASFSYGSNVGDAVTARSIVVGQPALLPCSAEAFSEAACYINDADLITEIGFYTMNGNTPVYHGLEGIQGFRFDANNITNFKRLTKFIWRNTQSKYNNEQTTQNGLVSFTNMKLLKELIMTYCVQWTGNPTITSEVIRLIDFRGTPITGITIPETDTLEELHLPDTLVSLSLKNLPNLNSFSIDGVGNLVELNTENIPNTVTETIMAAVMNLIDNGEEVKLTSGELILNEMDNESYGKIVGALGIEVFTKEEGHLYIQAPQGVYLYVPGVDIEAGKTQTLQASAIGYEDATVKFKVYDSNHDEITPVDNVVTTSNGTTLNVLTGEMTTTQTDDFYVEAVAVVSGDEVPGAVSEQVNVTPTVYTYPTISINGNDEIRTDGQSSYGMTISTGYTARLIDTKWEVIDESHSGIIQSIEELSRGCILNVSGVGDTLRRITLKVTARFEYRNIEATKSIDIQLMKFRFVDLGLPSGTLWANMNLGANVPEEAGLYYQWGEVNGHAANSGDTLTKATYDAKGLNDILNGNIAPDSGYDVAREACKAAGKEEENWRMPTSAEITELINNCNITRVVINQYPCWKVTPKDTNNKNYIYIRQGGVYLNNGVTVINAWTYIWSSTHMSGYNAVAFGSVGTNNIPSNGTYNTYNGLNIRPVK